MIGMKTIVESKMYHEWNPSRMISERNVLIGNDKAGDMASKMRCENWKIQ